MGRLQGEGIRGADLVFACIGPALEIFSRYSKVVDPQEREIPLGGEPEAIEPYERGFLAYVWETVGRRALEQSLGTPEARARSGMTVVLEEDARLTALFLWTLQSTNGQDGSGAGLNKVSGMESDEEDDEDSAPKVKVRGYNLVCDVVRRFAQPLGIDLSRWEGRIIETKKGVVCLLAVSKRAKQLFGQGGATHPADWIDEQPRGPIQLTMFPEPPENRVPKVLGSGRSRRVARDIGNIELRADREATTLDRVELHSKVVDAETAAKDEVWGGYRFAVIADQQVMRRVPIHSQVISSILLLFVVKGGPLFLDSNS